jgi:hypothetical protein
VDLQVWPKKTRLKPVLFILECAKSLKISKGYSEAINKWRSDNIMTEKKNDSTDNDLQNTTQQKLKIEQHGSYINREWTRVLFVY